MRRILFTIAASVALVAFVPASAIARSHHRHHHHHHHHKRSHARVRTFGHFTSGSSSSSSGSSPSSSGGAGTVTSFDPNTGKLVITLNDGTTTETGQVTSDTEFECQSMDQTTQGDDGSPGDSGGDNQGDNGGDNQGDNGNGDDNGNDGGDDQGDQGQPQNCSAANLTPGTTVQGAELRISSDGAVWEKIEL